MYYVDKETQLFTFCIKAARICIKYRYSMDTQNYQKCEFFENSCNKTKCTFTLTESRPVEKQSW
jgi:hypothetical protein